MSRFESGTITPKLATLDAMGLALGVPAATFLAAGTVDVEAGDAGECLLDQYRRLPARHRRVVRTLISALLGADGA